MCVWWGGGGGARCGKSLMLPVLGILFTTFLHFFFQQQEAAITVTKFRKYADCFSLTKWEEISRIAVDL